MARQSPLSTLKFILRTPFLRNMLLAAVAIAVLFPLFERFWIYPQFNGLLIRHVEEEAGRTADHFSSMLLPTSGALSRASLRSGFDGEVAKVSRDFNLEKVKLFADSGETIYSTDAGDIGKVNRRDYFRTVVAAGGRFTKVVRKDRATLEGRTVAADVVETYVPIMRDGRFVGAFEIYYDVTEKLNDLQRVLDRASHNLMLLTVGLLLVVVVVLIRAGREARTRLEFQDALIENEARFRGIVDSAQDAIILMDHQGRISFWNRAAERIFGYPKVEVLGRDLHALLAPKRFHQASQEGLATFWETGKGGAVGATVELAGVRKGGGEFPLELSIAALQSGGAWSAIGTVRDITDRKRAEEHERHAQFQAGVAEMSISILHNIGNAIMGIINRAEELQHSSRNLEELAVLFSRVGTLAKRRMEAGRTPQETLEELIPVVEEVGGRLSSLAGEGFSKNAEQVRKGVEHIAEIVKRHRDVAGPKPHRTRFDLRHLIEDAIAAQRESLEKRSIRVAVQVADGLSEINMPRGPMLQMLVNLISNGCEAIAERSGRERIEGRLHIAARVGDDGSLEIRVADNGGGIPGERLVDIFRSGYTTRRGGAGLGLHAASNFVQSVNGTIEASSPGTDRGAEMVIRLPMQPVER